MRQGVLVFEDTAAGAALASRRVAGLSLLDRQVRTLQRAGIAHLRIVLPAGVRPVLSRHARRLPIRLDFVTWQTTAPLTSDGEGDFLLLMGAYVHHHSSLKALLDRGLSNRRLVVQTGQAPGRDQRQVRVRPEGVDFVADEGGPTCSGAFLCAAGSLPPLTAAADTWALLQQGADKGPIGLDTVDTALWHQVWDRRSSRAAKAMLFGQVTKTTSGPISRHINARMSIPISKLLIETGISPHMVTVSLVLTTGLASAYLVTHADDHALLALAGFLWQMAAVLDRCDGEIARVKLCESKFGAWFDTVTDNIAYLCAYAGIMVGMHRLYPEAPVLMYLGVSAVLALILALGIMYRYAIKTGSGSLQHYLYALRNDIPDADKGLFIRIIDRYGFVTKRDSFSFFLFLFAVAGYPELIYGFMVTMLHMVAVGVLYTNNKMVRAHRARAAAQGPPRPVKASEPRP